MPERSLARRHTDWHRTPTLTAFAFGTALLLGLFEGVLLAQPKAPPAPKTAAAGDGAVPGPVELTIKAVIDGRDELRVTREGFEWVHHDWDWPAAVNVNGHDWNPKEQPKL